ncbi:DUF2913 family protein [Pantoea dispersa]|uniref:DUF2913 family protein n=1 Tax=Pantoea dispersa TaxID=59814 RepID=UPI001F51B0E7|nr:DUF2913 family protein [Pantoea dispersa]MCI1029607.1 DUF2913 family protein [Pantoea dispersa]
MYAAPEKKRHQVAHLAWCALVALHIERQNGLPEQDEHDFLVAWLKAAHEAVSIHPDVKEDIGWLLQQADMHGKKAFLIRKITYVWHMTTGQMIDNADMLNLTRAINFARSLSWGYQIQEDTGLFSNRPAELSTENTIVISRLSLDDAFNSYGQQVRPVKACIRGSISGLEKILRSFQWDIVKSPSSGLLIPSDEYHLMATDKSRRSVIR